jgi:hypothetical protein
MQTQDAELLEQLRAEVAAIERLRGTMGVAEQLTVEAFDCARRDDFEEARHRLRLRDNPKWFNESECGRAYAAAMADKRARSA